MSASVLCYLPSLFIFLLLFYHSTLYFSFILYISFSCSSPLSFTCTMLSALFLCQFHIFTVSYDHLSFNLPSSLHALLDFLLWFYFRRLFLNFISPHQFSFVFGCICFYLLTLLIPIALSSFINVLTGAGGSYFWLSASFPRPTFVTPRFLKSLFVFLWLFWPRSFF